MADSYLEKLFEHNNWANLKILETCAALTDAQLDAEPQSSTKGTIRMTLWHLVSSQDGYVSLMTDKERRFHWGAPPPFEDLRQSLEFTGEILLDLARGGLPEPPGPQLQTRDGYLTPAWVVVVQVINHATEHREQIKSMLSAMGITPPEIAGWEFGEATGNLVPIAK